MTGVQTCALPIYVLTFGARVVGVEMARMIVDEWLDNQYEGGRHQRRVDLLMEIE